MTPSTLHWPDRFPACLYGDAITVRSKWKRIMNRCWSGEDWLQAVSEDGFVSVHSTPGYILLADEYGLSVHRERHWRLQWVSQLISPSQAEIGLFNDYRGQSRQHQEYVFAGMQHLWFTVAMLFPQADLEQYQVLTQKEELDQFEKTFLQHYIVWLPNVLPLLPRCAIGTCTGLRPYTVTSQASTWWWMWHHIATLLYSCGYCGHPDLVRQVLYREYNHNILNWLLDTEIVLVANGRYQLTDA